MTRQDAQATPDVVTCTLSICGVDACVLVDPGSTHSFVSLSFAMHLGRPLSLLDCSLAISTPVGEVVLVGNVYEGCVMKLCDKELLVDLIPLDIKDFDIILGMNWLASYHASIDCFKKEVVFQLPNEA